MSTTRLPAPVLTLAAVALAATALGGCGSSSDGAASSSGSAAAGSPAATTPAASTPAGTASSGGASTGTATAATGGAGCPPATGTSSRVTSFTAAPPMCIDTAKTYTAKVTTDIGAFTIELDPKKAPKTVNNFVVLARSHFYDGIVFHRVIPGFMNQTGDPQGTGQGGPGYEFADELPQAGEYQVGSVAMANAGPNTNGSQFFVVTGDAGVGLPPDYSLFGKVTEGMDVVHAIEKDGSQDGTPTKQHSMKTVTITEK